MKKDLLFVVLLVMLCAKAQAAIPSYVPTNGLVAWYPFNGNANDESGNGNNGTVSGPTLISDRNGNSNSAYYFNSGANLICTSIPFSNPQAISYSVWVKTSNQGMLLTFDDGQCQHNFNWDRTIFLSNNQIGFYTYPGYQLLNNASFNILDNNWHNVVITFDSNGSKFYVDGLLIANYLNQNSAQNYTGWFRFGGLSPNNLNNSVVGAYDDIGIWNRALTQQEISALYASPSSSTCTLGSILQNDTTICPNSTVNIQAVSTAGNTNSCFSTPVKVNGNVNFNITSTTSDPSSNIYHSGAYTGNISVGGTTVNGIGGRDFFLVKYDSCGTQQWVIRGGSTANEDYAGGDFGKGLATDASGNVYMVGRYNQTCTIYGMGGTSFTAAYTVVSGNANHQDGFLLKISPSGAILWGATIRGGSNDGMNGVTVDPSGNPIITAGFNGCCPSSFAGTVYGTTNSLNISSFGSNYGTGAVVKFNSSGAVQWAARIYNRDASCGAIKTDANGNIYVTSSFRSWSNGTAAQVYDGLNNNYSLSNPGIGLAYLMKLSPAGAFTWGTTFGNNGDGVSTLTQGTGVDVDSIGNIWVSGYYSGAAPTFYSVTGSNMTAPASTGNRGFVVKYSTAGQALAVNTLQQTANNNTQFYAIACNGSEIRVVGNYSGSNAGLNDILIANYNSNAVQQAVQTVGGTGDDNTYDIRKYKTGYLISGSAASGTTIGGTILSSDASYLWNTLGGTIPTPLSYLWSTGATSSSISVNPAQSTTYYCTFSTGSSSCMDSIRVSVNSINSNFIVQDTIRACGASYTVDAGAGYSTYSWSTGATTQSISATSTGWYRCTVTQNSCSATDSVFFSLVNAQILQNDTTVCSGSQLTFNSRNIVPSPSSSCSWQQVVSGDCYKLVAGPSGKLFIPRRTDMLRSFDNGVSWSLANWPLGVVRSGSSLWPGSIYNFVTNQLIQCALDNGYWISSNDGSSFTQTGPTGFGTGGAEMYQLSNGRVLGSMGGFQRGVYKSNDINNNTWSNRYPGVDSYDFVSFGDSVLFSATSNSLLRSTDQGDSWTPIFNDNISDVERINDSLFWINSSGNVYIQQIQNISGTNVPRSNLGSGYYDAKYDALNKVLVAVNNTTGIYLSADNGRNWSTCTIPGATSYYDVAIYSGRVFVGTNVGLFSKDISNYSYLWSTSATTPTITVNPTQTTTYYCTVSNGISSCTDSVTVTVNQATTSSQSVTACSSYTWNGQTYTQSGSYTYLTTNAAGCDSLCTLNLTISQISPQPSVACYQTATLNSTTCQWDVTGQQPVQPTLACYEIAAFNNTTCQWDVTGTPPAATAVLTTPINCYGGTGVATVTVTGGAAPFIGDGPQTITAGTYSFTVVDANGCSMTTNTVTIPEPTKVQGIVSTVDASCTDTYGSASATSSGGTGPYSYLWSNGQTTASISSLPVGIYTVTVTDSYGCTGSASGTVSAASTLPGAAGAISGSNAVCRSTTITYSILPVTGATSYVWSIPAGATGSSTTNSITLTFGSNYIGGFLCVTPTNACGSGIQSCLSIPVITVKPTQPGTISLSGPSCGPTVVTCSISAVSNATSYTWAVTSGAATILAGQGTRSIQLNIPAGFTNAQLSVYASNCKGNSTTRIQNIIGLPSTTGALSGSVFLCPNSTQTFSVVSSFGATSYAWSVSGNAQITSQSGPSAVVRANAGWSGGILTVIASNSCGATTRNYTLYATPLQPGAITGPSSNLCDISAPSSATYSIAAVNGATSYSWTAPAGMTITSNSGTSISVSISSGFIGGNICVTANNTCGSSPARCLPVTSKPMTPGAISGPGSVCASQSIVPYSISAVTGATHYQWISNANTGIVGNGTLANMDYTGATASTVTLSVAAVNACGMSSYSTKNVAVNLSCKEMNKDDISTMSIFPNPTDGLAMMRIESAAENRYLIQIEDMIGREVYAENRNLEPGTNWVEINASTFSPGIYLISVVSENEHRNSLRLIVR